MHLVPPSKLSELQNNVDNIRNICILAHVDHGKTTLADSLVASNGIISQRSVGNMRYLDSRPDEQKRGITMKSSSISLMHCLSSKEYLVNLIDSPGHVDFSSEVSTAVRLCDGAIIVVDVVEGVCPQTRVAIKQAYSENIKPVLVLNKIDRLILEMQLKPIDAYVHLTQLLEQVNAVLGEFFVTDVFEKDEIIEMGKIENTTDAVINAPLDWTSALEEADDSHLYFTPESGNVVFSSAVDGWGFVISTFAKLFSEKLGVRESLLLKVLWGDYYFDAKNKKFMKGAQEKAKKPVFVQLVLENIWSLYETVVVRKDKDKIEPITKKLGINLSSRDLRHKDVRVQLQAIISQWLPLSTSVLDMVCNKLPSPKEIPAEKVEKLMCSQNRRFDSLNFATQSLKKDFLACDSSDKRPVIIFISKMFPMDRKQLPENKPKLLTPEELAHRREVARQRHAARQNNIVESNPTILDSASLDDALTELKKIDEEKADDDVFIGFARIFSGTLRKGCKVYVLGPKHDPNAFEGSYSKVKIDEKLTLSDLSNDQHITCFEVNKLYLLMGRELEELEEVPAGNILGIGGLEEHVLKTATLSSTVLCPPFTEMQMFAVPIVRVAVETQHPADMPKLVKGLKLLNQADACVQILVQETGEHVLLTAGEVHLERCLEDLSTRYVKVPIAVSEPIVPFRETIVETPKLDMVNEEIDSQNIAKQSNVSDKSELEKVITMHTPNKQCVIKIRAVPLPQDVTLQLEKNADILKMLSSQSASTSKMHNLPQVKIVHLEDDFVKLDVQDTCLDTDVKESKIGFDQKIEITNHYSKAIEVFKSSLEAAFKNAGSEWNNAIEEIWSTGPRKCGPNLLLNRVKDFKKSLFDYDLEIIDNIKDSRHDFTSSFINGFQLASLAGPLCEEPMMGVAFIVEEWNILKGESDESILNSQPYGPFSGQIMSAVKEGCRKAFQAQPQRIMAAMYSCHINVKAQVIAQAYTVLRRRHGKLICEELDRLSSSFKLVSHLPVMESFRLTHELRKQTSGLASIQLVFSHWETIEIDPFWTPSTEMEYIHYGEKADSANRAKTYMDAVRRRKGLHVDDKLVESAEKQRTLSKNK